MHCSTSIKFIKSKTQLHATLNHHKFEVNLFVRITYTDLNYCNLWKSNTFNVISVAIISLKPDRWNYEPALVYPPNSVTCFTTTRLNLKMMNNFCKSFEFHLRFSIEKQISCLDDNIFITRKVNFPKFFDCTISTKHKSYHNIKLNNYCTPEKKHIQNHIHHSIISTSMTKYLL